LEEIKVRRTINIDFALRAKTLTNSTTYLKCNTGLNSNL
jgi:hypothetical protein